MLKNDLCTILILDFPTVGKLTAVAAEKLSMIGTCRNLLYRQLLKKNNNNNSNCAMPAILK